MRDAVTGGVQPGETYAETVLAFLGENRSFQWAPITPEMLVGPAPEPDEATLEAYYDANPETFTAPETRRITFAWLTPDMLLGEIEVDEAALRALYDERRGDYDVPERRLVERLVFESAEAADEARAAIDAGNSDFAAAVEARGLALEDVDLGEVARDALAPAAAEAVFALDAPGVVGPVESALGPALYRVNAILEARLTPYEEAREDLLAEFAGDRARRVVDDSIGPVDDLLASGATLEEVAAETAMELGRIDFTTASEDGIAGYDAFREEALLAQPGDFPEVRDLSDGGIFALRVDEVVAPALRPFDEVRDEVAAAWSADETQRRLRALGESLEAQLAAGTGFEALGLEPVAETGLRRDAFIDDAPPGLVGAVFALDPGAVALVEGDGMVALARLDSIAPYDRNDAEMAALRGALAGAQADGIASDLYTLFTVAVRDAAGISLDPAAINAVHAQFP
jgi:peptidyl-prolyl cis-trans isomerase D